MNADRRVPELDLVRAALVLGVLVFHAALYALLKLIPGAGVLLGQRKRSSSRARTSAAAPAPSLAVT